MPRTGVSVLRNEPEFLDEWVEKVAGDLTRPSPEERLIRRRYAASGDASDVVRARSAVAFRERKATSARVSSAPRPVRAPRTGDTARTPLAADRAVRTPAPPPARPSARTAVRPSAPPAARPAARTAVRPAARTFEDPPERRTVTIRGQVTDRYTPTSRRRADVRRHERPGFQPDRVAMWAVMLGLILVLVAATSAHAATLVH